MSDPAASPGAQKGWTCAAANGHPPGPKHHHLLGMGLCPGHGLGPAVGMAPSKNPRCSKRILGLSKHLQTHLKAGAPTFSKAGGACFGHGLGPIQKHKAMSLDAKF